MSKFTRKRAIVLGVVASLAITAVAIAYWSTTGTGSGTGTVAANNASALAITGDAANGLVPGGSVPISGTVTNSNPGSAQVGQVTGAVDAAGTCGDSYFTITDVSLASGTVIAPGATVPFTATLNMANDATNSQNDCKSAALTITWSSN